MGIAPSFRIGNITNSYGVAIGHGARAEVSIFEGPAFPRPNYRSEVADLLTYYTRLFVGREQESEQLRDFARSAAPGYLLVTAGAGFGKSALAASLIHRWETGQWAEPAPDLVYFFVRQQGQRHTPIAFLQGVNGQLLDHLDVPGGVPPDLPSLRSQFSQLWGAAVARAQSEARPLLLLVDGLDEMALQEPSIADLLPTDLPSPSTVIVTSRPNPDPRAVVDISHPLRAAQMLHLGRLSEKDVAALLAEQGASTEVVALAPRVWTLTQGEPLLARFVGQEVAEQGEQALQRLEAEPPDGVESYFRLQLAQLDDAVEESDLAWEILGVLTVSLAGLTLDELSEALGAARRKVRKAMAPIQRFLIGESRVELMHQQFHAVLEQEFSRAEQRALQDTLLTFCARWPEHQSPYALRYYAEHLAQAAAERGQPLQHELTTRSVDLVHNEAFQQAHLEILDNLAALQRDLELALDTAAVNHPDEPAQALLPLVRGALGVIHFAERRLRPDELFELAEVGKLEVAERRLGLFPIEEKWRQVAALALAWVAADQIPDEARALMEQTLTKVQESVPFLLGQRVRAALDQHSFGQPSGDLPAPPTEKMVQRIIGRFGGVPLDSGLEPIDLEMYLHGEQLEMLSAEGLAKVGSSSGRIIEGLSTGGTGDAGPVFIAAIDGLHLVAYSLAERERGQRYFERYVDLQASNSYVYYRNVSLWFLLDAALRHPEDSWARPMVRRVVTSGLAGGEVSFREARLLVLQALQARTGDSESAESLAACKEQALKGAAALVPRRGHNDAWGHYKRTLAALAEAYTVLDEEDTVETLLERASNVPPGYAGFQTMAALAFAESGRVAAPQARHWIDEALTQAGKAAHNVQEPVFCARSTARVTTMQKRWWNDAAPFDAREMAQRLAENPNQPEFSALHIVGEAYSERERGPDNLRLPESQYTANTLRQLADLYQRPLTDFEQLNRDAGWAVDQPLPAYAPVNVPDPELAPYLAARFAAELLVMSNLKERERIAFIQRLVPVAADHPTTLDIVLARLLIAAKPGDVDVLGELAATET